MRHKNRSLIALAAAGAIGLGAAASIMTSANAVTPRNALGLSGDGKELSVFNVNTPRDDVTVGPVKGLEGDTKLIGIDYRPADARFYGVGDEGGIYRISPSSGNTQKVSQLSVELEGAAWGVDFNPAADRLRIVSDTGQNLRHDVRSAEIATNVDGVLDYAGETATGVYGTAYTNNDNSPLSGTQQYDLDANLDQLVQQAPPNDGVLNLVGKFGVPASTVGDLDILTTVSNGVATGNTAYAIIRELPTKGSAIYRMDLSTGVPVRIGYFDRSVADIAIKQPVAPAPAPAS